MATEMELNQQIKDRNRLMQSLTNITPDTDQVLRIEQLREFAKNLGTHLCFAIQPGRERSLAMTHLEETVMWGVKAILMEDPPAKTYQDFKKEQGIE
jgi:hypothetical protein